MKRSHIVVVSSLIFALAIINARTVGAQTTVYQKWDTEDDGIVIWAGGTYAIPQIHNGDLLCTSMQSAHNYPTSRFILILVKDLRPGDEISGMATCQPLSDIKMLAGYWGQNDTLYNEYVFPDPWFYSFAGTTFSQVVPEGAESVALSAVVIAGPYLSTHFYIDSLEVTVPDHATVYLPDGTVPTRTECASSATVTLA